MKHLATLMLFFALAAASPAAAQVTPGSTPPVLTRPELARVVEQVLMRMEGEPSAETFARLGAAGRDALVAITSDVTRSLVLRRRAAIALQHYRDDAASRELRRLAADAAEDAIVSRYALRSLARAFGSDVWSVLVTALSDARSQVREGAVLALAEIDRDRAATLLASRIEAEPEAFVRSAMRAVIER